MKNPSIPHNADADTEDTAQMRSFGVFKPVGHVVISFPDGEHMQAAAQALHRAGYGGEHGPQRITDREMVERADADIANASPLAAIGQELNLVKAQRELALLGYHFLVVKVDDDEGAALAASMAEEHRAERAQYYGRFVIEDLISHPEDEAQVAESPDRGLDAQTPSGDEAERAEIRPPDDGSPDARRHKDTNKDAPQ
jgi:hypothetical protein